jgi:hypothetical protein
LLPGYALTGYTAQGGTFTKAVLDLATPTGKGVGKIDPSDIYVLLSRMKTRKGLLILRKFNMSVLINKRNTHLHQELTRLTSILSNTQINTGSNSGSRCSSTGSGSSINSGSTTGSSNSDNSSTSGTNSSSTSTSTRCTSSSSGTKRKIQYQFFRHQTIPTTIVTHNPHPPSPDHASSTRGRQRKRPKRYI